jgi:ABC-type multidrug transport system fused ATPase/permease subunit
VAPALIGAAVLGAARAPLIGLRSRRVTRTAEAVSDTFRGRLYAHMLDLGPGFLLSRRTGAIETAMVDGADRMGGYYGQFVPTAVVAVVSVAAVLVWVAVLDPMTGLAMLIAAVLVPLAPILTARAFGETGRAFAEQLGRTAADYLDAIQGMLTLKASDATRAWGRRLGEQSEELSADATSLAAIANMHIGFVSLGMAAGTVLAAALATLRATHGAVGGPALLSILLLARVGFRPLGELQAAFPAAYQAAASANAVFDLLDAQPEAAEPAQPVDLDRRHLSPSVAFEQVTFAYRPDRAPALNDVSFEIAPGETVALVGPSGAGKTTVVSALLRFFDPQQGRICVGGHDIRTVRLADLRSLVAVTFQDSYLFHTTVRDNIRLGRPDASATQVEAAARAANAHEFIVELPDGYDTIIGEQGGRLSGGERQRLAIARAVLADTPILVLDEPTSSVDAASESLITAALQRLTDGRTTLIIAHRLSTVQGADRILVLDRGRIVESGPPGELRHRPGVFARLVEAQQLTP